jgi:spermidine dehydrogenase
MNSLDRELGMGRQITRRHFLQGAAASLATGGLVLEGCGQIPKGGVPAPGLVGAPISPGLDPASYPPLRSGLRGSHEGSFEMAHALGLGGRKDWGRIEEAESEPYDLVVVGGGVSGLSAAYFFLRERPDARILILDNHDDFGGHAKRNEFQVKGRTILGHGGSQSLEGPGHYSKEAKRLLKELGINTNEMAKAYDRDFYRRNGLANVMYFDKKTYGEDRIVRNDLIDTSYFLPVAKSGVSIEDAIDEMPLSDTAKLELIRLFTLDEDQLPDASIFREPSYLSSISYEEFLRKHLEIENEEVIALLQDFPSFYLDVGIDAVPALDALLFGLPGLGATSLGRIRGLINLAIRWSVEPYVFHFPDGNATVARMLVRRLIPDAMTGSTMQDTITANVDYSKLDEPGAQIRLRLGSTVIRVEHEGEAARAETVNIVSMRGGQAERVKAKQCILAGYNMMIPFICPELPDAQKQALRSLVKVPFVYTNVVISNWTSLKNQGLGIAFCPGSWHRAAILDFPISYDRYHYATEPDQTTVLHMQRTPLMPGYTPREQYRAGRYQLLKTPFEDIEREIRTHLGGMLGPGGFDPARDIEGIAVNRWPHGYAFSYNSVYDPEYAEGEAPHEIGRRPFGRIAIANSDSGAGPYLDFAIDQGFRAASQLLG